MTDNSAAALDPTHACAKGSANPAPCDFVTALRNYGKNVASLEVLRPLLHPAEPLVDSTHGFTVSALDSRIFEIMFQHSADNRLQYGCLRLLADVVEQSTEVVHDIVDKKGVQIIAHSMLIHKDSFPISFLAVCLFSKILRAKPDACNILLASYVVELVVSAAKTFLDDENFQHVSLNLLFGITQLDDGEDLAADARRGGAARAAMRALKRHRKEEELSVTACDLLQIVTKSASRDLLEQMYGIGVVRLLAVSTVIFRDCRAIQESAYTAIYNLAVLDDRCLRQFSSQKGMEMVLRTIRRFRECVSVNISCVALLRLLIDYNHVHAAAACSAGADETALSLMIEYRKNAWIQAHAIAIMSRLVRLRDDIRLKILGFGGSKILTMVLLEHFTNRAIVDQGVRTLKYMCHKV